MTGGAYEPEHDPGNPDCLCDPCLETHAAAMRSEKERADEAAAAMAGLEDDADDGA